MKVLIIKLGALGDVLMATPLIQRLVTDYAAGDLWLLTTPPFAEMFAAWPTLKVRTFPRRGVCASFSTVYWMRSEGFDRVYDLQSNRRTGYWCALSGIRERVGNHPRYPYTHYPRDHYNGQCHAFERLNQVMQAAGHRAADPTSILPRTARAQTSIAQWLAQHGLHDERLVLLHAGASARHAHKRWPHFKTLAMELAARHFSIVWVGGQDDTALNRELARAVGYDATGCFDVSELAELGRHACFAVTNDSAPMHILASAGIPIFGIFGPTDWRRTHALGHRQRVISLDSAPTRSLCPAEHQVLANLSVQMVLDKLAAEALI